MPPPPPPPLQQQTRLNLGDLKSQIIRKLGPERAQRYFGCLNQLLAQKLSKPEFNKFCLLTLGREFIPLHNQLIRSILKNACQAKIPQRPAHDKGTQKHIGAVGKRSPQGDDGFKPPLAPTTLPPVWSNGDILPPSPRKSRSSIRDRRIKDRPSPLGPTGRADVTAHQSLAASDENVVRENGVLGPCDLRRPVQLHHGRPAEQPTKRQRTENFSPHDRVSVHSESVVEVVSGDDGEEFERSIDSNSIRGALQAPLGIPFCHASVGGRSLPLASSVSIGSFSGNYDSGELCHTEALRSRMEKIAEAHGLGGVTMDCANLLNNGLDTHLKRLIKSCVEMLGARSVHEPIKHVAYKKQPHGKPINGVWPGNHMHVQSSSSSRPLESTHEPKNRSPISLQDFKVAMELNPQVLGEDWPLLLEKICIRSFEEQG